MTTTFRRVHYWKRTFLSLVGATAFNSHAQVVEADTKLPAIIVETSRTSQLETAESANTGIVTQEQLEARTVYRAGEMLEATPGLIVSQHSGEGKANQFYLRGFNLDHGTDFLPRLTAWWSISVVMVMDRAGRILTS